MGTRRRRSLKALKRIPSKRYYGGSPQGSDSVSDEERTLVARLGRINLFTGINEIGRQGILNVTGQKPQRKLLDRIGSVASKHAEIYILPNDNSFDIWITDMNSRFGTVVRNDDQGDIKVTKYMVFKLRIGDIVLFGRGLGMKLKAMHAAAELENAEKTRKQASELAAMAKEREREEQASELPAKAKEREEQASALAAMAKAREDQASAAKGDKYESMSGVSGDESETSQQEGSNVAIEGNDNYRCICIQGHVPYEQAEFTGRSCLPGHCARCHGIY